MNSPSKNWKEEIAPDEEERFSKYAKMFSILQKQKSKQFGNGRALHRKQLLAAKARLEVLGNLPEYAKIGLFKEQKNYEAFIRLSNGGLEIKADSIADIRGFAIKILGLKGEGAMGGEVQSQSFLLINQEAFSSTKSADFVELVGAVAGGNKELLKFLFKKFGFFGMVGKMIQVAKTFGKPFTGCATEKFYSAVPISCGEYACKVRILPISNEKVNPNAKNDWGADFKQRIAERDLEFELQLQFFVDDKLTPIEDASIVWQEKDSPYIPVAKLIIPKQDLETEEGKNLQKQAEEGIFDPWVALKEHRPLGDVMRARKHVYFASQKNRKAVG
jgi:hypothetical protein